MTTREKTLNEEIERVLTFLNSRGVGFETGIDRLDSVEATSALVASIFGARVNVSPRSLGDLRRLRQALVDLVESGWEDKASATSLNEMALRSPYTLSFQSQTEVALKPASPDSAVSLVLKDVAALVNAGRWPRMKNCANEACASTFFDHSRNKTQRWHSFEVCGNKHNVAAHRARHA